MVPTGLEVRADVALVVILLYMAFCVSRAKGGVGPADVERQLHAGARVVDLRVHDALKGR